MSFFDDLIESSLMNSFVVTHHKVTVVGYDDDERPSWEDSTVVASTFRALHNTSKTTDWIRRMMGDITQDDTTIEIPSNIVIDEFAHLGVKDKLQIDDRYFEASIISNQTMFDITYISVTLKHLVGVESV